MSEKYVLVEHSSAINKIISSTFQTTHRIKFTAFDVSTKYIIFGANSGGIYIFNREPCQFLKLMPGTHGPATLVHISPNQEDLAIATSTGVVVVLEQCLNSDFQSQVFTEHEGQTVTAMKWNGDDLYCGDSTGHVSVITLKNFLTMFQTPVASLMHLDSQIVQMDAHSKFLLISTQTRTVLCDTETERYRQVGKKMRDGPFGACFLNRNPSDNVERASSRVWGVFKTLADHEQLPVFENEDVKIYCARPGVRLWQADFRTNVVVTHQFRSSLSQEQSEIIQWNEGDNLKIRSFEGGGVGENFSFSRIYSCVGKFILTFNEDGFYIFEPSESVLLHWSNHISNIKDLKIVGAFLYVWHNDLEVSVLSLMSIEELIIRSLFLKKYKLSGGLCVKFYDDVQSLLDTSKKIHLISILETELEDFETKDKLKPIFERLRQYAKAPSLEKLGNGVVTVNAFPLLPESVQNFKNDTEKDLMKESISIVLQQFKINKTHKNTETTDFVNLVESLQADSFYDLIVKFQAETAHEETDSWCKEVFLKHLKTVTLPSTVLDYACTSFLQINSRTDLVCKCDFPLPQARKAPAKYFDLGCQLMKQSNLHNCFLKKVPAMHRFHLKEIDQNSIEVSLPLMIQFGDLEVLEFHSDKMTVDIWDESIRWLLKLKSGQCLNCGSTVEPTGSLEWTDFGLLMVQSINPVNAIKLLKRYAKLFPKGALDSFFYQYCIFSSVVSTKNSTLTESLRNENVQQEFNSNIVGFLRQKYLRGGDYYDPVCHKSSEVCDHCQMPLRNPILEEVKRLSCGHKYHVVCFLRNDKCCLVCVPLL